MKSVMMPKILWGENFWIKGTLGFYALMVIVLLINVIQVTSTNAVSFWSAYPHPDLQISNNGVWETMEGTAFNVTINIEKYIVISYDAVLEGLRHINANPLPREGNSDTIQVRCLINGVPYRPSSTFSSTFGVEAKASAKLSNLFVVNLSPKVHEIKLQWKKYGTNIEKWIVSNNAENVAFSFFAYSNFKQIYYFHEQEDKYLTASGLWKPLSNNMTLDLARDSFVTISYSLTVQPQLSIYVKDRAMEYLSTRALVDNVAYTDSVQAFGTNAWNPLTTSIRGNMTMLLPAGKHLVNLQWKKMGTALKHWVSSPSYFDGFASSRNLVITVDKFDPPYMVTIEAPNSLKREEGGVLEINSVWVVDVDSSLQSEMFVNVNVSMTQWVDVYL